MAIKPIDVRRKEFKNSLRGYDANQVDDFLDSVADEFERTYSENSRMREEISGLRERLQQFTDLEGSIRAALVHAEQAASDLRESANREAETLREGARREAELTINEAKSRSHQMLADSSSRVERVQESYEALREAKQSFAADFRLLLKSYLDVMDNADIQSARDIESSLRDRLDTESVAVAREAAAHTPESQPTLTEQPEQSEQAEQAEQPSPEHAEDSTHTPQYSEQHDDEETRAFTPEDMAAAQGLASPPRIQPTQEPARSDTDEEAEPAGARTYEPFEAPADEQGTGPLAPVDEAEQSSEAAYQDEPEAPETTEPEIEPTTVPEDERTAEPAASTADDGDDTKEHGTPADEGSEAEDQDARYDEFFDRENAPQQQEGRVSRASRFLRRRG